MDETHIRMIERIHRELVGDEFTEGLIPEFKAVKKRVNIHEIQIRAVIGLFLILALIATLLSDWINIFGG